MFNQFLGYFSKDLGVDLGTTNVRIFVKGRGMIINEPSIVAINTRTGEIISLGIQAFRMLGKSPAFISVVKPIENGIISDFEVTEKMLKLIIDKVHRDTFSILPRPRMVIPISLDVTEVEKKSVEDVALQAGARQVFLVERPVAAAIGAKLPIHESIGTCVVEMGGGLTEVAVISLSGVVSWRAAKTGGAAINKNIINYVREKFNVLLGEQTTEDLKIRLGSVMPFEKGQEMRVRGRDLINGLPREIVLRDSEVREAMMSVVTEIAEMIHATLEATPAELIADVYERGIVLSGGSSLIRGFDRLIQKYVPVPVHIADDPLTCAVRGAGMVLEDFENLKSVILPSAR
ncbi:MAG: rod shape-determining protein [Parcubacteria group bacterium]|nr:rod shape-determining protein [Parcubacteria group bacterium]